MYHRVLQLIFQSLPLLTQLQEVALEFQLTRTEKFNQEDYILSNKSITIG